jgi:5'-nucleotidase / UDP-sugar diphosphatase
MRANWLALAATLLVAACIDQPDNVDLDGQDVQLVFMHSSDIHSRLVPYALDVGANDQAKGLLPVNAPFGGMSRLAALVREERNANERFAYIETGDVFQGAPIFNSFGGEPELRAMTQMQVDAYAIGNHEFDNGAIQLVGMATKFANFPMLAANYLFDDWHLTGNAPTGSIASPYTILKLGGLRVGVVGIGDVDAMRSIFKTGNTMGITPLSTKEILQKYIDLIRPMVDVVVIASHAGYHQDLDYIPRIEGVDIVFGGHLHIALDPPNVLQDCDVAKLKRERDQYICDTEEKLRPVRLTCVSDKNCDNQKDKQACYDDCAANAIAACQTLMQNARYADRLKELDDDIKRLVDRGCHPRDVLLVHSGAFLKYAGKLTVTVRQCTRLDQTTVCTERDSTGKCVSNVARRCVGRSAGRNDWEVIASKYQLIPIDKNLPDDAQMLALLEPFKIGLNRQQLLDQIQGFSSTRLRRYSANGADSQVGNMVADSMQVRNQVWADFAITNSLGIRQDIVPGGIDEEMMTNVFPFENMITVMYLSGYEVQELMDFITQRSTQRGCQSQAQVAGVTATLNCGGCSADGGNRCVRPGVTYDGQACAQRITIGGSGQPCAKDEDCQYDQFGKFIGEICSGQAHPSPVGAKVRRCWAPIACNRSYRLATNDYIANGGSGFKILERNTTKKNLGISLRQATKDYIRAMPACSRTVYTYNPDLDYDPNKIDQSAPIGWVLGPPEQQTALHDVEQALVRGDIDAKTASYQITELRKSLKAQLAAVANKTDRDNLALRAGLVNYLTCTNDVWTDAVADQSGIDTCTVNPDGTAITPVKCTGLPAVQVLQCTAFSSLHYCSTLEDSDKKAKCLSDEKARIEKCQALGRVRGALRCLTLPCVNAKEDGRLQRIAGGSGDTTPTTDEPWPE